MIIFTPLIQMNVARKLEELFRQISLLSQNIEKMKNSLGPHASVPMHKE
jgi:hypothetical protein